MRDTLRAPFDAIDAEQAAAYLSQRKLTIVDPFTAPQASEDLILRTSLSSCRFLMAHSFNAVRADGRTFRA